MSAARLPDVTGTAALRRLLDLACGDTGQSGKAANFLLAWWNARSCGVWDLTDLWMVDRNVADDMLAVAAFVAANHEYPGSYELRAEFEALVAHWRPHLGQIVELTFVSSPASITQPASAPM